MYSVDQISGLLTGAKLKLSPNRDERPNQELPSLIVIHNISLPPGQFGGDAVEAFFTNTLDHGEHPFYQEIENLCVSAHLFIRRCGEVIQFVPFHERAWHAGVSCYSGRERCNDYSIGIELEGADLMPYESAQYQALLEITQALLRVYPDLSAEKITGHSDISPGRKTDPGEAFKWYEFRLMLLESQV